MRTATWIVLLTLAISLAVAARSPAASSVLRVGPGERFSQPSQAFAAARDGDTIRIAAGHYDDDVAVIDRDRLTVEGIGVGRAVVRTDGRVAGRKGIWVFAAGHRGLTVRNVELSGARVSDADGANGAGLRIEGEDVTIDGCRFADDQDGILGGAGTLTIERCQFDRNGPTDQTHNVYVGDRTTRLVFRFNDSRAAISGHLLKSRAAENVIAYNCLDDGDAATSYEVDLPNGGRADVVGNLIHQTRTGGNGTLLAFGEEGHLPAGSRLFVAYNTFVNDRPSGTFISVAGLPQASSVTLENNLFAGVGRAIEGLGGQPVDRGNVRTSILAAAFVDSAAGDFRPTATSPAVGRATPCARALFEFAGSGGGRPRAEQSLVDAGAFAHQP